MDKGNRHVNLERFPEALSRLLFNQRGQIAGAVGIGPQALTRDFISFQKGGQCLC